MHRNLESVSRLKEYAIGYMQLIFSTQHIFYLNLPKTEHVIISSKYALFNYIFSKSVSVLCVSMSVTELEMKDL